MNIKPFVLSTIGITLSLFITSLTLPVVPGEATSPDIGPEHRSWTTGTLVEEHPADIGPRTRVWTEFGTISVNKQHCYQDRRRFCDEPSKQPEERQLEKHDEKIHSALEQLGDAEISRSESNELRVRFNRKVLFESGSDRITAGAETTLDKLATILREHSDYTVVIQGHTNDLPIRTPEFDDNQQLSEARAEAVRNYLISQGIASNRLNARGYGASRPIVPNTSAYNRRMNRRVDFLFRPGN